MFMMFALSYRASLWCSVGNVPMQGNRHRMCEKNMRKIEIGKIVLIAILLLLVGAGMNVSAEAIGDAIMIGGINLGWILIGLAIVIVLAAFLKIVDTKKFGSAAMVILLLGIILAIPYETAQTTQQINVNTDDICCQIDLTGSALNSGAHYFSDATWDDDTYTLTVPITVSDSSDGNLSAYKCGVHLTIEPICDNADNTKIVPVSLETDYLMKYGGEYVLDENSTNYDAKWGAEYIDDVIQITAGSTESVDLEYWLVNGTSGSWVSELDQVGDTITWHATVATGCDTATITVQLIVVSYTA